MSEKMVFINFPVTDIKRATEFYKALGFQQNMDFSNETSSGMMWDKNIWIMLSEHEFYGQFLNGKTIADTHTTNSVLVAFNFDTVAEVDAFVEKAETNGGSAYTVELGLPADQIVEREIVDPDGNHLEAIWMATSNN